MILTITEKDFNIKKKMNGSYYRIKMKSFSENKVLNTLIANRIKFDCFYRLI